MLLSSVISHGWDRVAEGEVYAFLFCHGELEHHGVLSLCMGIKTYWFGPPVKLVRPKMRFPEYCLSPVNALSPSV